jgi:hypothetical protein
LAMRTTSFTLAPPTLRGQWPRAPPTPRSVGPDLATMPVAVQRHRRATPATQRIAWAPTQPARTAPEGVIIQNSRSPRATATPLHPSPSVSANLLPAATLFQTAARLHFGSVATSALCRLDQMLRGLGSSSYGSGKTVLFPTKIGSRTPSLGKGQSLRRHRPHRRRLPLRCREEPSTVPPHQAARLRPLRRKVLARATTRRRFSTPMAPSLSFAPGASRPPQSRKGRGAPKCHSTRALAMGDTGRSVLTPTLPPLPSAAYAFVL